MGSPQRMTGYSQAENAVIVLQSSLFPAPSRPMLSCLLYTGQALSPGWGVSHAQHPSEGWQGDAHSQLWGWPCPEQVPRWLCPPDCAGAGVSAMEPCARQQQEDTRLCQGGAGGAPVARLSLCVGCRGAWGRRGAAPVSPLRLMPSISELLARVRAELEMSGTAAG